MRFGFAASGPPLPPQPVTSGAEAGRGGGVGNPAWGPFSPHPSDWVKFFAALQYAVASLGIMFANKIVLTTYDFDSFAFLTLCQVTLRRSPLKGTSSQSRRVREVCPLLERLSG